MSATNFFAVKHRDKALDINQINLSKFYSLFFTRHWAYYKNTETKWTFFCSTSGKTHSKRVGRYCRLHFRASQPVRRLPHIALLYRKRVILSGRRCRQPTDEAIRRSIRRAKSPCAKRIYPLWDGLCLKWDAQDCIPKNITIIFVFFLLRERLKMIFFIYVCALK